MPNGTVPVVLPRRLAPMSRRLWTIFFVSQAVGVKPTVILADNNLRQLPVSVGKSEKFGPVPT
jgi:hypothetical protein